MEMQEKGRGQATCGSSAPTELCREAIQVIEKGLRLPSNEFKEELEEAEKAVVRLRDCVIDRLRDQAGVEEQRLWRKTLDEINVAVSLIAGVEYPAAGIQRQYMEQAEKLLKRLRETLPGR